MRAHGELPAPEALPGAPKPVAEGVKHEVKEIEEKKMQPKEAAVAASQTKTAAPPESDSDEASSSSPGSAASSSQVACLEDLEWVEWGLPLGPAARLHRLKEGRLPGCAKFAELTEDRRGCGFTLAALLFPGHSWCVRCAPDVNAAVTAK